MATKKDALTKLHFHWGQSTCRAWSNVSEQPDIGADHNCDHFWTSILEWYKLLLPRATPRTIHSLYSCWCWQINKDVQLFCGIYCQVTAEKNGWSDPDYVSEAENRFALMNNGQLFQFRGCGLILKNSPKFNMELGSTTKAMTKNTLQLITHLVHLLRVLLMICTMLEVVWNKVLVKIIVRTKS